MEVQVNLLAVLLATLASMVIGSVWYAKPVFGTAWQRLVGLRDSDLKKGATSAILQALVCGFLTAYVLAHITYLSDNFFHGSFMQNALQTAFWIWLGFSATTVITHNAFEQRRKKLTLMTIANQLVTFLVMGAIIGWLKP